MVVILVVIKTMITILSTWYYTVYHLRTDEDADDGTFSFLYKQPVYKQLALE